MGHGSLGQEVVTHDPSDPSIYVTQVTHGPLCSESSLHVTKCLFPETLLHGYMEVSVFLNYLQYYVFLSTFHLQR